MGFHREVDFIHDYDRVQHKNEVLLPPGETLERMRDFLPRKGQIPFGYFVNERYSTDIAAAWQVIRAMRAKGFRFSFYDQPGTRIKIAQFFNAEEYGASVGETEEPLAICNAALGALGAVGVEVQG